MKVTLVLQSYGSLNEYKRAVFSILSFYAQSFPSTLDPTLLFTDDPEFFRPYLKDLPVRIISLDSLTIRKMRGEIDFVHRVKIAVIDRAFALVDGNILYVDSDTFFIGQPRAYTDKLTSGNCYMHKNEYYFREMKQLALPAGKTFHVFYEFVEGRTFYLSNGSEINVSPDQISWNAGVIILHNSHKSLLGDVFYLTDQFYPQTQNHGCEQYAFSIILGMNTNIRDCEDLAYHYWPLVKKKIADKFLARRIIDKWSLKPLTSRMSDIKKWSPQLRAAFTNDVLMLRDQAIQRFNVDDFKAGIRQAFKAIVRQPFNIRFITDVGYHLKRFFLKRLKSR